jgi:hypothetical protein
MSSTTYAYIISIVKCVSIRDGEELNYMLQIFTISHRQNEVRKTIRRERLVIYFIMKKIVLLHI